MPAHEPDTDELLDRSAAGDGAARQSLLERHRPRLTRMVAVRLDRRLAARLDPSDVVQEALAEAAARLSAYLRERPATCDFFRLWRHRGEQLFAVVVLECGISAPPAPAPRRA